ncbi:chondroitin sulfate proteoglycan 4-like protein [Lates japonicus]|uniref:Chondroitin sulfate proteoglycan 4-like protein n=1 Tax=Lates japonicus TaxID=270547 RepID=A0AAD3NK78_LATJO|nr:chondroitin sulfate proteoglycan 4-like protein [Lates japonicus]
MPNHLSVAASFSSVSFFIVAVSFYGDGYIHLRTDGDIRRTMLHVRFRTSVSGLLFLATWAGLLAAGADLWASTGGF